MTPDMPRCAIYARLSREDEDKHQPESESIQNQKALLISYAAQRGWDIYRIYCDEDYSGVDSQRPDFNRMLQDAREKRFQIILCKSQSRFTRDMELVEKYIHGLFPVWGIRFIAVADNADTEVKGNKKARQINGLVNEWYLEDLSENIRMVFDMKRRQGQYIGSSPLYGYRRDPTDRHKLAIDPPAALVVRQIFHWSLAGYGQQAIVQMLNQRRVPPPSQYKQAKPHFGDSVSSLWNKTAVWRFLHNEMYTGVMIQGRRKKVSYKSKELVDLPPDRWFRVEDTHEAIVDHALFDAVQQQLTLRTRAGKQGELHPLAGLVRCLDCGAAMRKTSNGRRAGSPLTYLRCQRYADSGSPRQCSRHSIRLDYLLETVEDALHRHLREYYDPALLKLSQNHGDGHQTLLQEKKMLTAQLSQRIQALQSLYLDKVSGLLEQEQFRQLNCAFLEEKSQLEQRLTQVEQLLASPACGDGLLHQVHQILEATPLPHALAIQLIQQIEIGEKGPKGQEIRITWKF